MSVPPRPTPSPTTTSSCTTSTSALRLFSGTSCHVPLARQKSALSTAQRRSFVSTVLLSRTWENETLVELRKEAIARGLSNKGNKSTLIARIQEHEKNSTITAFPPIHTPDTSRGISNHMVPPPKKTSQAACPGIPLTAQPDSALGSFDFVAITLPDLSQPLPNAPVQVPYVPDFWNSAQSKVVAPLEFELPKLHVVSGSATHYGGGPTYNLEKYQGDLTSTTVRTDDPPARREVGFWADFYESLGLPRSFSARRTLSNLAAPSGRDEAQMQSRSLTGDERRGLYVLLGIVGGSWLVGGLVNRPVVTEEHDTQNPH